MHEVAIVENSFKIILEVARSEKLSKIRRVNFLIGEMHGIVPDIFRHAFQMGALGTIVENAELNMEIVPVSMQCKSCEQIFAVKKANYLCPACGSADLEIKNGKELAIKSIEGE